MSKFPTTFREAVATILSEMSGRDKMLVRNTRKEDLIKFDLSWGQEIRNRCGLWKGNDLLIKDAKLNHPDSVSTMIMEAVWEKLQNK